MAFLEGRRSRTRTHLGQNDIKAVSGTPADRKCLTGARTGGNCRRRRRERDEHTANHEDQGPSTRQLLSQTCILKLRLPQLRFDARSTCMIINKQDPKTLQKCEQRCRCEMVHRMPPQTPLLSPHMALQILYIPLETREETLETYCRRSRKESSPVQRRPEKR